MKRTILRCAAGLLIAAALLPTALAAEPFPAVTEVQVCYPTSVTRSEDGTEIRKVYDLSPEQDPAGIPRSDFEQDGFHYTLTDLLQQELPEHESRPHTETVSLESKSKDMESVLALLPQEKEFVTEDGLSGTLSLQLDTVQVEAAGYGSSTREVSATRSYPNLASQDTASIPKSIEEDGRRLEGVYQENQKVNQRLRTVSAAMEHMSAALTEWDEEVIHQLLEKVTVLSREKIRVTFRDGREIEQYVAQPKRRKLA